ncbi:MAG: 50S ribosomal protein L10 [Chitinophagaceae bacterium]|nr:50S ribosomal protein L10 [Chitinophagaceae bacterium]
MTEQKRSLTLSEVQEQLDETRFQGAFDSLHGVTALMFSDSAKEPAMILTSFRSVPANKEKPVLKAAFIDGDLFIGDNQLAALRDLKSKQDLIGEIIGLLQSPAKNVISALNAGNKLAGLIKALEERQN